MSDRDRRSMPILVVDDDSQTRDMLVDYLEDHNLPTLAATDRQELSQLLAAEPPRLVILDPWVEQRSGFDILREIRSNSDIPVIITGRRDDEVDRVVSLELGADDYLVKPFRPRELLARIRAVLRRRESGPAEARREFALGLYRFGGWELDRDARRLTCPRGDQVPLTKGDFALLIAFLDAPQRPLSREYLLHATRLHEDVFDRSIDVQVLRLRRKLEPDRAAPKIIVTERGVGYVFALPVETL